MYNKQYIYTVCIVLCIVRIFILEIYKCLAVDNFLVFLSTDALVQLVIDSTRHILYTRSENNTITVCFHVPVCDV